MNIVLLRPDTVAHVWPQVEQRLSGTLELVKDTHLPTDVLASILTGNMFLFVAVEGERIKGATVAHFTFYPRMKACVAFLVGGEDMPSWIGDMCEATERFARAQGCGRMEAMGRDGWAVAAGYTKTGVALLKGL